MSVSFPFFHTFVEDKGPTYLSATRRGGGRRVWSPFRLVLEWTEILELQLELEPPRSLLTHSRDQPSRVKGVTVAYGTRETPVRHEQRPRLQ